MLGGTGVDARAVGRTEHDARHRTEHGTFSAIDIAVAAALTARLRDSDAATTAEARTRELLAALGLAQSSRPNGITGKRERAH